MMPTRYWICLGAFTILFLSDVNLKKRGKQMNEKKLLCKAYDYKATPRTLKGAKHRGGVPYVMYCPVWANLNGARRPVPLKYNFV